jgi:hypothetical protein
MVTGIGKEQVVYSAHSSLQQFSVINFLTAALGVVLFFEHA